MDTSQLRNIIADARRETAKVIIGQEEALDLALITIITGSHALVEGVPGVAKTLLVRTLAKIMGCDSQRIQFTPDLMPADIIGTNVFNIRTNEFTLVKGPVFTTFLLADEINRAPAKTQSALLQAMQERQVTIDRETYPLSPYFTVFATQNPIEYEGTYPLPEAQKDRFMFRIPMDPLSRDHEMSLARRMIEGNSPEATLASGVVNTVLAIDQVGEIRQALAGIVVRDELIAYAVDIVRRTRSHSAILVGAGPRATQSITLAARAMAALRDRDFVIPDDIRDIARPVLSHRLVLRPEVEIEGATIEEIIQDVVEAVPVPR